MFTWNTSRLQLGASLAVAAAIVGVSGLVMEHGHRSATRRPAVDVADLEPVDVLPRAIVLPEVVVTAPRLAATGVAPEGS
jgi:hypothetical protein